MSVAPEALREGMAVRDADGRKLGRIEMVAGNRVVFERGFFWPREYATYLHEIDRLDGRAVVLVRGAHIEGDFGRTQLDKQAAEEEWADTELGSELRVPLTEEQLEVTKHVTIPSRVRLHREVRTEMRHITVPVTREVLRIERVPANEPVEASGDMQTFSEQMLEIPLHEEEVVIHKHPVVREVVRVTREVRSEERTLYEPVRRLDVNVERTEVPDTSTDTH